MENKIHFDRSRQPETVIPERLEVPEACEYRTASGVRIYVLPAPEYGVVRLSFVFRLLVAEGALLCFGYGE